MKLPKGERALIPPEKIIEYLLNVDHERGGSKAQLLLDFGYSRQNWERLEQDIRRSHLTADVQLARETAYGTRYEISEFLETPSGRKLRVRTIWQTDRGTDVPRFITLFPD